MASPLEHSGEFPQRFSFTEGIFLTCVDSGGLCRNFLSEGGCAEQVIELLLVLWEGINAFHDLVDPDEEEVAA